MKKNNDFPKSTFSCGICEKKKTEIPYNKNLKDLLYMELCCDAYCVQCIEQQANKYIKKPDDALFKCIKCLKDVNVYSLLDALEEKLGDFIFDKYRKVFLQKKPENNKKIAKNDNDECCLGENYINECQDNYDDRCCDGNEEFKENEIKEENIEEKSNLTENELNAKLIKDKGYKKCPNCQTMIEKYIGCNIIICETEKCQKKIRFCYCCQQIIKSRNEEFNHFPKGIFKPCVEGVQKEKFN